MQSVNIIKQIHKQYFNDPVTERIAIASLICSLAKKFSNELVVVGGSAVEFYTAASYMTKDIDFVAKDNYNISKLMGSLGFSMSNGYTWFHPDTSVVVEFPKAPLLGDVDRVTEVVTPYGVAKIIGIEDIILDRLKGRVFWQDDNELPETMLLAHYAEIDFNYLNEQAKNELVEDALEKAIVDVDNYKNGRSPFLRNNFYDDKVVEIKIIDALEYDVPVEKIVARLAKDDQVKGKNLKDKEEYLRSIIARSQEIQELL